MPRVFNQKIKILYLMRIFLEQTDEEHPMSVKELIAYLNSLGISAERKTVYDDIETLRNFGMDILNRREHPAGFYLASREFELPELRLLVDAVQSSRCITNGKSRQLITVTKPIKVQATSGWWNWNWSRIPSRPAKKATTTTNTIEIIDMFKILS